MTVPLPNDFAVTSLESASALVPSFVPPAYGPIWNLSPSAGAPDNETVTPFSAPGAVPDIVSVAPAAGSYGTGVVELVIVTVCGGVPAIVTVVPAGKPDSDFVAAS
ncbi:hypothetical protein FEP76_02918 [Burkholderia multivorans]|nr:hypothetical protein [Burkholderia multivorans]